MNCPYCDVSINDHEATPCLNVWVAEIVMEWEWWIEYRFVYPQGEPVKEEACRYLLEPSYARSMEMDSKFWERATDGGSTKHHVLYPTTFFISDIDAAWEVLEKITSKAMEGHVGKPMLHRLRQCAGAGWGIIFCSDFGYTDEIFAPTAPLAICRAALKAKSA